MMQWLHKIFHGRCLERIRNLIDDRAKCEAILSKGVGHSIEREKELEILKEELSHCNNALKEATEVINEDVLEFPARAQLLIDMSAKLDEAAKYNEDSKQIITRLNEELIEAKGTLEYCLWEKNKEIAELNKYIEGIKSNLAGKAIPSSSPLRNMKPRKGIR